MACACGRSATLQQGKRRDPLFFSVCFFSLLDARVEEENDEKKKDKKNLAELCLVGISSRDKGNGWDELEAMLLVVKGERIVRECHYLTLCLYGITYSAAEQPLGTATP
jgi:hypothetical protein